MGLNNVRFFLLPLWWSFVSPMAPLPALTPSTALRGMPAASPKERCSQGEMADASG